MKARRKRNKKHANLVLVKQVAQGLLFSWHWWLQGPDVEYTGM